MRALVAALVFYWLAMSFGAGTAAYASTDPYADQAAAIGCPTPPHGWSNPSEADGGRNVLTPLTPTNSEVGFTILYGGTAVEVDCNYFTPAGSHLEISVRYALPLDVNPFNDFDVGCTFNDFGSDSPTGAHSWDEQGRTYRIVGETSWSYATFFDSLGAVGSADVAPFEGIARAMLSAAQPLAHRCGLSGSGKPVALNTIWDFSFAVNARLAGVTSAGSGSGSFTTSGTPTGGVGVISKLHATDIRLRLTAKKRTSSMTIRVGNPIEFEHGYSAVLRADVIVVASTYRPCKAGSTGTLSISDSPKVMINVCGRGFLEGPGSVVAKIVSV